MAPSTDPLPGDFAGLAARWRDATGHLSDPRLIFGHPAYRAILALGPAAVPLILRELAAAGGPWLDALRELTGEHPVPPDATFHDCGPIRPGYREMRNAWLAWGVARGHLPPAPAGAGETSAGAGRPGPGPAGDGPG